MPELKRLHVLLVDDGESDIRDALVTAFRERGYGFSVAEDVEVAKAILAAFPIDIVLVDPQTLPYGSNAVAGTPLGDAADALGVPVLALPGSFAALDRTLHDEAGCASRARRVLQRLDFAIAMG